MVIARRNKHHGIACAVGVHMEVRLQKLVAIVDNGMAISETKAK